MKYKRPNYYFLVHSEGGLIQSVQGFNKKADAIRTAQSLWSLADPETDDIKIFRGATGTAPIWRPE